MSTATKDKLLDTAYNEFWLKGYNAASVDSILKSARLPKGSFYHFFASKKALGIAVIQERIIPTMEGLLRPSQQGDPIKSLIDAISRIGDNERLLALGCPLNKLIREMLPQEDREFSVALMDGYQKIEKMLTVHLQNASQKEIIFFENIEDLSKFILATTWGTLSLGEKPLLKEVFLSSVKILENYLDLLRISKE